MSADAPPSDRQIEFPAHRLKVWLEPAVLLALVGTAIATALIIPEMGRQALLSPWVVALALVLNLLPAVAFLVLVGRRIALRRVRRAGAGDARLHTRLVTSFSATAAIPTIIVVAFSAFQFQSGMEFWFSERSRGMFENAVSVAQNFFENEKRDVGANTLAMATDLRNELARSSIDSQGFYDFYVQQVVVRELSGSAIIEVGQDGIARSIALIDPDSRAAATRLPAATLRQLEIGQPIVASETQDGVDAVVRLIPERRLYLYASRGSTLLGLESIRSARSVFADYNALFARSRELQFRFVLALYIGALVVVGLVIISAILVADRIVKPIDQLASAAQEIAAGNLEARVRVPPGRPDEIATLASAFNMMTEQLSAQTRELLDANVQIEDRRSFIEAVLSSVASGVISLDAERRIRFVNAAAARMIGRASDALTGLLLRDVAPELDTWLSGHNNDPILSIETRGEQRTWAVKIVSDDVGVVLTAEDITQQLFDQRRAAWSDVARRIAHEIKNPLTPIQLAAERLQKRFGTKLEDEALFGKLTSTIVRQVGDLRRMVDEFSDFAKVPKPVFRSENIAEILKQSVFLQEIASPAIAFSTDLPGAPDPLVCDRRLMAQCFTNILKNAVEAIDRSATAKGEIHASIELRDGGYAIAIGDNGIGLPTERDSITEPYVTTRDGGTGLGLAIVQKIVEEHRGTLSFGDRPGGGTIVQIILWPDRLAALAEPVGAGKES